MINLLDSRLALIVFIYNEAENLPRLERDENLLKGIGHEVIIVVNDNSSEGTGELTEKTPEDART